MMMPDDSCLPCHGLPENAPPTLLAEYGTINGFSWPRHGVIAAQVVYVPADLVFQQRRQVWLVVMLVLAGASAASVVVINFLLRRSVIQPVERMAQVASRIAAAEVQGAEPDTLAPYAGRADEVGQLSRVFQKMAAEVYAREQRLRQQLEELRISVDEGRKARQVAEITETEYFQQLQRKAKGLRQRSPGLDENKLAPDDDHRE
jgi:methyl-accepting chemotaxis protein